MPQKVYSDYNFTPTEMLVLETLTARYRLGENVWTFTSKVNKTLGSLETKGVVNWKSAPVENHSLAWFTSEGKALMLRNSYAPREGWGSLKKHNKKLRKEAKTISKRLKNKE